MATTEEIATLADKIAIAATKKTVNAATQVVKLTSAASRDGAKALLDARIAAGETDLGVIGTALTQYVDAAILAADKDRLNVTAENEYVAARGDLDQFVAQIIQNALFI